MFLITQRASRLLLSGILSLLITNGFCTSKTITVSDPGLEFLTQAQQVGPLALDKNIEFIVDLKIRNKAQFDALYHDIYDPKSPRYHQYLTREEYTQKFAPAQKSLQQVAQYLSAQGMKTNIVNERIKVHATVAQIEKAFQLKMNQYYHQNKIIYANTRAPRIDATIGQYILGISGLNNIPHFHKMVLSTPQQKNNVSSQAATQANQNTLSNLIWDSFKPQALPTDTSLNGFTGAQLRSTYNVTAIPPVNGVTIDGSGQTIVILDAWGVNDPETIMNDANQFSQANNLPLLSLTASSGQAANFAVVRADGIPYGPNHTESSLGWTDEIALDIASVHTIAPKANIVLVLDNNLDSSTIIITILNSGTNSFAGFPNAYVLSNSWGGVEYTDNTLEINLQRAAMSGLSVDFSSADCGDGSYNSSWPCTTVSNPPRVEYPASSPYVTAIGGTSVFVDNNYNYSFETGWGSYYPSASFYAGSTGGISQLYSAATWQNNNTFQEFTAGGYGIIGLYHGGGLRAVPDIAMLADIHTGLIAYYTHGCESGCIFGGTSVACPLYSATLTLINQSRLLQNKATIGLSAQYLYDFNQDLSQAKALNFITPPHQVISGSIPNPTNAPLYAFTLFDNTFWYTRNVTFNWDSSLTMNENQYWNDVVGVGSPNIPVFVPFMAAIS